MNSLETQLETWRAVVGYEGRYEVSDEGRVRSLNYNKTGLACVMTPVMKRNYVAVHLSNGKPTTVPIHIIVAAAFIGPRPPGMQINHKSGIKTDNRACNLEYCSPSENARHAHANGLIDQTGESNNASKLSAIDAGEIKRRSIGGERTRLLANEFGVSIATIEFIRNGKRWAHIKTERGAL